MTEQSKRDNEPDRERYQGTVKWFSNKKGYGFITSTCPTLSHLQDDSGNPIPSDIFVHQSTILSDGYRTLDEGWPVEFSIGYDHDGKPKAEDVTAPGGGVCTGPRRPRYHRRNKGYSDGDGHGDGHGHDNGHDNDGHDNDGHDNDGHGGGEVTNTEAMGEYKPIKIWHHLLSDTVKDSLHEKGIATVTGTIDIAVGKARIKLGTRSYSSMAHEDGILLEGSFHCDTDGSVLFHWKRAIHFVQDSWKMYPPVSDRSKADSAEPNAASAATATATATANDASTDEHPISISNLDLGQDTSKIIREVNLSQDAVHAVKLEENIKTLMGENITDPPRSVFEEGGFEMRRVVLTTKKRVGRTRGKA